MSRFRCCLSPRSLKSISWYNNPSPGRLGHYVEPFCHGPVQVRRKSIRAYIIRPLPNCCWGLYAKSLHQVQRGCPIRFIPRSSVRFWEKWQHANILTIKALDEMGDSVMNRAGRQKNNRSGVLCVWKHFCILFQDFEEECIIGTVHNFVNMFCAWRVS